MLFKDLRRWNHYYYYYFFSFLTLDLLFSGDGGSLDFTSVSLDQSGRQSTPPKAF